MTEEDFDRLQGQVHALHAAMECVIVALSTESPKIANAIQQLAESGRARIESSLPPGSGGLVLVQEFDSRIQRYVAICNYALDAHERYRPRSRRERPWWRRLW